MCTGMIKYIFDLSIQSFFQYIPVTSTGLEVVPVIRLACPTCAQCSLMR